jgi:hypothetical protein
VANNGNGYHASPCSDLVTTVVAQAEQRERIAGMDKAMSDHNRRQNHSLEMLAEDSRATKLHLRDLRWGLGLLMLVTGSGHPAVVALWKLLGP